MIEFAHLRNKISSHLFDEKDRIFVKEIITKLNTASDPFAQLISRQLVYCLHEIDKGNFRDAEFHVQLIHNLPKSTKEADGWDEGHFYQIELLSFLENIDDVGKIKAVITGVSKLIEKYEERN